jgi:hypothetical protein
VPFVLIAAPGERETDRLIEAACAQRRLRCVKIVPGAAGDLDLGPPDERRLIYRTGVDRACVTVEELLFRAGDAALHDPFFQYSNQPLIFQRAGLPRPRTVYVPDPDPTALARQVEGLGGYPVVVKAPGTEGGKGVSLAHDLEALATAIAKSKALPSLEAFVAHARCWRVTVLNGRMLAVTARAAAASDFRTNGPGSGPVDGGPPPPGLADIAIRGAQVLRLEFGGADIMEAPDGRLVISEFNFPCYFADQQRETGVDIAGAIVDRLIAMPPHPTAARW